MNKSLLHILIFCLCALLGFSQNKEQILLAKKLDLAISLYQNGSYDLVFSELESIENKMNYNSSILHSSVIQSKLLKVQTYYAVLEFEKANASLNVLLNEIEQLPAGLEKDKSYVLLASFYNEIGSYLLAFNALEKGVLLANTEFRISYDLQKLFTLLGQKNLQKASDLILKTEKSLSETDSTNQNAISQKATFQVLKAKYLLSSGNFEQAKEHFSIQKKRLANQPIALSQLLELEAEMYLQRQQYDLALTTYQKAYSTLSCSDYQTHKIYLLGKITALCVRNDDVISYGQYKRRLQMYADKNIHRVNYFQLTLNYSEAYSDFVHGDYAQAIRTIEKTSK